MSSSVREEMLPAVASGPDVGVLMASGEPPTQGLAERGPAVGGRRLTSLTVVIPARDEALNIASVLRELDTVLNGLRGVEFEVLVIDDGSTDSTRKLAECNGARVLSHPEGLGNGAAVKRGIREARCAWVLLLDGDGQHPPSAIPAMLAMAEQYDLVVGSRNARGGSIHRNLANRIYNCLASYVTKRRIPDLTSGFRLVRADVAKGLVYLLPNSFSYPTTMTLAMLRSGYAVGFLPFRVRPRRGRSHIRLFRDGSQFLLIILRIATFFAPLRVFLPLSLFMGFLGLGWYVYTYLTVGRFTNMSMLLITQATIVFVLGLISEQVAALRFDRVDSVEPR